jgi:integrase
LAAEATPWAVPLLRCLWLSGLRLSEALNLWWDDDNMIHVENLDGRRPVLANPGRLQKNRRDTLMPLTPDFVEFLREMPAASRTGPVFLPTRNGKPVRTVDCVGRILSEIGKNARIVVHRDPGTDRIKWASAHDLRRSFGDRWALRVMPVVLKELMRHASIETTMKYYVGRSAEDTGDAVWAAYATAASTSTAAPKDPDAARAENGQPVDEL